MKLSGFGSTQHSDTNTKVAVVGAGAAGIVAARYLSSAPGSNLDISLFEGNERLGGRMFTEMLTGGIQFEHGAEGIDGDHRHLIGVAHQHNIPIHWHSRDGLPRDSKFRLRDGTVVGADEFMRRVKPLQEKMILNRAKMEKKPSFEEKIAAMTVEDYIWSSGVEPLIAHAILSEFKADFGKDPNRQSAMNLFDEELDEYRSFRNSITLDGLWAGRFQGGSSSFIDGIYDAMKSDIDLQLGHRLVAVNSTPHGNVLTFETDQGVHEVRADIAIITVPIGALKGIKIEGTSEEHRNAIAQVEMGEARKFGLVFNNVNGRAPWAEKYGSAGDVYFDMDSEYGGCVWDASRGRHNEQGYSVMSGYVGGSTATLPSGKLIKVVQEHADILNQSVYPGIEAYRRDQIILGHDWNTDPLFGGGFFSPTPGMDAEELQTTIRAREGHKGSVMIRGEGTDTEKYGFMDGAVRQGISAARDVMRVEGMSAENIPLARDTRLHKLK